jgi:hypothetical protein
VAALVAAAAFALTASAAVSPTVRISLVHFMRGCHVWSIGNHQSANAILKVKPGTRIEIRVSCPMSFELSQVAGPKIPLADPVLAPGTTRVLVFKTRGVYRFTATNLQSSSDAGLQTLGDDNRPMLTVRVG